MANNPYVNKVAYAGQTLVDLTEDTATANDVLNGKTFHDRSGAPVTGNVITHDVYDGLDSSSASDALSAKQGKNIFDTIVKAEEVCNGSTRDALVTALNSALASMPINSCKSIRIYMSDDVDVFIGSVAYIGYLFKAGSASYARIIVHRMGTANEIVIGNKSLDTWGFELIPKVIDGLSSTSTTNALSAAKGKELKDSLNIVKNNTYLGSFSTESELSTILDTQINNMDTFTNSAFSVNATADIPGLFTNTYYYYGILYKGGSSNNYCHVLFYSNVSSRIISGSNASGISWTFKTLATVDNVDTSVSDLESSHFGSLGTAANPIASRNNLPLNWVGNVVLDSSISPSGFTRSHSLIKFGLSSTRYNIIAVDQYDYKTYIFENYDGTSKGWRSLDPQSIFDLAPTSIPSNATLSSYNTPGLYYVANSATASTISDCPYQSSGGRLEVLAQNSSTNYLRQMYYPSGSVFIYTRVSTTGTSWGNWYKITMEQA